MDASIKEYGADPAKCFVVESGVNTNLFTSVDSNERDKTRKELGLIFADKVILNAGFIKERKNIHVLVEALTYLPIEYKLILMGDGDEKYIERITKYVEEHHLENRVLRIGVSPYREVPYAMQVSNIFVLPSYWEGTSKAVLESLSCGVPVLYSGSKLKDELQGLFYLKEIDPKTIATEIRKIVESEPFVDTNRIRSLFSWDRKVEEIEKVYNHVLEHYKTI
jgi:glycosyltransferase involved in cell wall biosynthesis